MPLCERQSQVLWVNKKTLNSRFSKELEACAEGIEKVV
jgi:hypothetical protein